MWMAASAPLASLPAAMILSGASTATFSPVSVAVHSLILVVTRAVTSVNGDYFTGLRTATTPRINAVSAERIAVLAVRAHHARALDGRRRVGQVVGHHLVLVELRDGDLAVVARTLGQRLCGAVDEGSTMTCAAAARIPPPR